MMIMTKVKVLPNYGSIQLVVDLVEPWLEILGGDEWGESMENLSRACYTDYGISDEDCALFATKLIENLEHMKTTGWIDKDGPSYGIFTPEDVVKVQERCRGVREFWLRGGNLGPTATRTIELVKATLATIPKWIFGEEGESDEGSNG